MKAARWAARALLRAPLRGTLLVGVLGVSVGLALIMITVDGAFDKRLDEIESQVGTTVTVSPAGSFGGGFVGIGGPGGGPGAFNVGGDTTDDTGDDSDDTQATLTDDAVDAIASIDHIVSYSRAVTAQYTGDELVGATIEPPADSPFGGRAPEGGFQVPVLVSGTDNPDNLASFGINEVDIVEGTIFDASAADASVAVVGQNLAEANGLAVGDTFDLEGETIEVIGIYTTGTQFGDNSMFLPLETTQRLFDREGEIDSVIVQVDMASNVSTVADEIRSTLGEDVADVTTTGNAFEAISAPLTDAADSSQIGMIAALIASAAIILFSVAIVARQRIREIGIFKALGASNWHVVGQMTLETGMIAIIAAVLGALATFPLAQTVANGLVSDPTVPGPGGGFGGPGGGGIVVNGGPAGGANNLLGEVDVAVSPEIFVYALGIAIGLALLATIIPAWYVGRVKPAEVLRYE
jgi:putative ABC transport system permease protein